MGRQGVNKHNMGDPQANHSDEIPTDPDWRKMCEELAQGRI